MGMNFYFLDKNDFEKQIIVDVLTDNNIKHKVITKEEPFYLEKEIETSKEKEKIIEEGYILCYDIMLINISLETFDYMKYLIDKKTTLVVKLNKCLRKRIKKQQKTSESGKTKRIKRR